MHYISFIIVLELILDLFLKILINGYYSFIKTKINIKYINVPKKLY